MPAAPCPPSVALDSTLGLLRHGYEFISRTCNQLDSDVFVTRLLGRSTVCLASEDGARLFYDEHHFARAHAAPRRLQKTLLGRGGVQGLDAELHRRRKAMFMSLMGRARLAELGELVRREWLTRVSEWSSRPRVVLLDEAAEVLCRAVCTWAGVPLDDHEVAGRTRDLLAMVDAPGGLGLRYLRGRRGRLGCERWLAGIVRRARAGTLSPPPESALATIAHHVEGSRRLSPRVAAVELLNVLRPTVAIAYYVVFAALALHRYPDRRPRSSEERGRFVQEVRRFYPFFPFAVARVRHDLEWRGVLLRRGQRALLDLYGINHDPRIWGDAHVFRPDRFRGRESGAFELVPQGGGSHEEGHRCAGEWLTVQLVELAVELLTTQMVYRVPEQDLSISLRRMPARPASRFVLAEVASAPPRATAARSASALDAR